MGFIYLLECSNDDSTLYKIGYTKKSVKSRIDKLQTGNPYQIREIANFESSHGRRVESTLHNLYKHKNIKNEWFNLDIKEVANFIQNCERIEKTFDSLKENPFFNKNINF
jgi:hypothetical protein